VVAEEEFTFKLLQMYALCKKQIWIIQTLSELYGYYIYKQLHPNPFNIKTLRTLILI